jgi:Cd2+/Zn2+-exporting ATPase
LERLSGEGKTSVVISFSNGVAGILGLMDEIKPDSSHALQQMMELNIAPVMLTGDGEKAAIYVAAKVGIKRVFGGLLPKDKAGRISELLKEYGIVAMVGDGINDAPALARASVGIAMGAAGSDTAIETANIALMNDKLSLLPFLVRLSKATLRRIRINTIGAVLVKLFFVILVLLGYDSLVFAIAADVGVTIAVILFSLNLIGYE